MHGHVALVQVGHEFTAQARGQQAAAHHQHQRAGHHPAPAPQREDQQRRIAPAHPRHQPVFLFLHPAAEEQRNRRRHEGERQQHRTGQREHHGDRHRMEHFSFHPGQREDRQVHRGDDAQPEQARADHLGGGAGGFGEALGGGHVAAQRVLAFAEAAQAVLDDDHRAVHDQAEVQRAQAHQVGRHATPRHAGEGEQHRQGNHRGGDQRRAEIAEQREQHHDHQQCPLDEVPGHGVDGAVHQRGAVVAGGHGDALGQAGLCLLQPCGRGLGHVAAVGTDQHHHRAHHHFVAVLGGRAAAQLRAVLHLRHVVHVDRHAFAPGQHDVADLLQVGHLAGDAHQELLAVALDVTGAHVLVVGLHRLRHVLQGKAQCAQPRRVRGDVHLALETADGVDLGDAGHVAQLRADHPVLQGAQVGGGVGAAIGFARLGIGVDGVHENLTEAGGDRAELRVQAVGNL